MKRLLSRVLSTIRPERDELARETRFAKLLMKHISKNVPRGCKVVLTGSVAKQTFLRDKRDVDIFILFPRKVPKGSLEGKLKRIMKSAFPGIGYQLSYAEHPYARFHFEGRRIDLVPAYKISKASERVSAVDRSVLHTRYVMRSLKKSKRDDVLLLKQFLRSSSIYGAEIKIGGFSGYLCELLIISYGSFPKLLRAAARWKPAIFIDLKRYYKTKKQTSEALEHFDSDLVVIDPTDKDRNVAAAVTKGNLKKFISLSKRFSKKPSDSFFFRRKESFESKVAKAASTGAGFLITLPRPDIVDDVLWGQLHKLMKQLKVSLKGFEPKKILADDHRHLVRIAIFFKNEKLPEKMLIAGPPLKMREHVAHFRKRHKRARFKKKNGKLFAEANRKVTRPEKAIRLFLKDFSKTKSHLAYPEEIVIVKKIRAKTKSL